VLDTSAWRRNLSAPGVTVVLQWCDSGVTVVLQWFYSGVTVVLQWCCSVAAVALQWCHNGVTVVLQYRRFAPFPLRHTPCQTEVTVESIVVLQRGVTVVSYSYFIMELRARPKSLWRALVCYIVLQ
jgi:hypothetical protein